MNDVWQLLEAHGGQLLGLAYFLYNQKISSRRAKRSGKQRLEDNTIRDYLEWCRQQDHEALLSMLGTQQDRLIEALTQIDNLQDVVNSISLGLRNEFSDLQEIFTRLSEEIRKPVLSSIPLHCRLIKDRELLFRDQELEVLRRRASDTLISGQPGAGKTFLLYHYAAECAAKFVLSDNPDEVLASLRTLCPPVLIVDDAADRADLLARLDHFRSENHASFRIIASCWPYEEDHILALAGLSRADILQLNLLGADNMAELVRKEFQNAGLLVENWVIREVQQQSKGRPGLALRLVELVTAERSLRSLIDGTGHYELLGRAFQALVGEDPAGTLAAFAVGGKEGMRTQDVARVLERTERDVKRRLKILATGGVIAERSGDALATQPAAFRHALLKKELLPGGALALVDTYEALFEAAPSRKAALITLIQAVAKGAVVDSAWLLAQVQEVNDTEVWRRLAGASKGLCTLALEHYRGQPEDLAEPALHLAPTAIIPRLLDRMVVDKSPEHSCPGCAGRRLTDWIRSFSATKRDGVRKRKILLDATKEWLNDGGEPDAAWRAFAKCLSLEYESVEQDPGVGESVTFGWDILSLEEAKELVPLWREIVGIASSSPPQDWSPFTYVLYEWAHPHNRNVGPGEALLDLTRETLRTSIETLMKHDNVPRGALGRWAVENGLLSEDQVDADFITFCPPHPWTEEEDHKVIHKRRSDAALALGDRWAKLPPESVAARLRELEHECSQWRLTNPIYEWPICSAIAQKAERPSEWLRAFYARGLDWSALAPLLRKVGETSAEELQEWLASLLGNERYRQNALETALAVDDPSDQTIQAAKGILAEYAPTVEVAIIRDEVSLFWMNYLAREAEGPLALLVALGDFRSGTQKLLVSSRQAWLELFRRGIKGLKELNGLQFYNLDKMLAAIPEVRLDLAKEILENTQFVGWAEPKPYRMLLDALPQGEKSLLIPKLRDLYPTDFTAWLIGDDLTLYRQLLGNAELKDHHLLPLLGDPRTPAWQLKAALALETGCAPEAVAEAALGTHWFIQGSEVDFCQGWIEKFSVLASSTGSAVHAVAAHGLRVFERWLDGAKQRESEEQVSGIMPDE
ncbi:MAG TPA: hypothetical protein PLO37_14135 [Candidatus Hydrogenedentes bacterium]|nr:hypothetical protein [Candidatus Hydrogenedentota bacterium]